MAKRKNDTKSIIVSLKKQLDPPLLFTKLSEIETNVKMVHVTAKDGKLTDTRVARFYKPIVRIIN